MKKNKWLLWRLGLNVHHHDDEESTEEVERTVEKEEDPFTKYGSLQEAFDALPKATQTALTNKADDHNEEHPEKSKRTSVEVGGVLERDRSVQHKPRFSPTKCEQR